MRLLLPAHFKLHEDRTDAVGTRQLSELTVQVARTGIAGKVFGESAIPQS